MSINQPTIALIYDFDKTLCTKDMQEYSFIPGVGESPADFWAECSKLSKDTGMDYVLAYMYLMLKKQDICGKRITRDTFVELGAAVELFPGVEAWFKHINEYCLSKGAVAKHYIISSGLKEIIEGSSIYKEFEGVFACEFHYNQNGVAVWPLWAVNYTAKTQFLFRINKGEMDISRHDTVNAYVADSDRPIPFANMIYIGDGPTDVPCMKLVKVNGGKSIAVYNGGKDTAVKLFRDGRVNFIAPADYTAGGQLDHTVRKVIDNIVASHTVLLEESELKNEYR